MDPRAKIKADIKSYENQKKLKNLYTAATTAALAGAGIAGYKGMKGTALGLGSSAFGTGFLRRRAAREEHAALNRVKRFYNLRDKGPLFNLAAILPESEKRAMLGSAIEAASAIAGHPLPHGAGLSIDLATLPFLATAAGKGLRRLMAIAAKQDLGKPLTNTQKILSSVMQGAEGIRGGARTLATKWLKHPVAVSAIDYPAKYLGPLISGQEVGKHYVAPAYRAISKYSPRHADLFLDIVEGGKKSRWAMRDLKLDKARIDSFIADMGGVASFGKAAVSADKKIEDLVKKHFLPEKLQATGSSIKAFRKNITGAGKAIGFGGAMALGGHAAGSIRKKNPREQMASDLASITRVKTAMMDAMLATPAKKQIPPMAPIPDGVSTGNETPAL
jgi:hypothetical protein